MEERKDPEEYLKIIKQNEENLRRGKLRIFFGMAAGVGKTYQMLESAHAALQDGHNIVIGYIETHGREDTVRVCGGIPQIKRKKTEYKGAAVEETDIDEIIRVKPEIVIIDELAHTNAPGSRHKKRYQDILEILNCGIDVWTTVNVQHIESRVSTVEHITGIKIGETVPDYILELADKIEIIDITPEELQKRVRAGKIYSAEKTETALNNFFREGNITALREISLQVVAKLVDKDITEYKREHNISKSWKAADKLLVAVGPSPFSAYLIKWTKKTAFNMKAEWIAVNIESPVEMSEEQNSMLGKNIELARELGAKIVTTADDDIVNGIIRTARLYNISQIVIGKSLFFSVKDMLRKNITDRLIKESGDIDVYVVSQPGAKKRVERGSGRKKGFNLNLKESLVILLSMLLITALNMVVKKYIGYWGVSLVYLLYIVFAASQYSRKASITVSVISVLICNYLFIPPKYTFYIAKPEDFLMYITFFTVAVVTGKLTSKLHEKETFLRKKERNLEVLYELSKEIAGNADFKEIMSKSAEYLERYFGITAVIYIYDEEKDSSSFFPEENKVEEKDIDIAQWVTLNGREAGRGSDTLAQSDYFFYPIKSSNKTEGVILLDVNSKSISEKRELLKTISFMIGSAIMREKIMKMKQQFVVEQETEKLYSVILKSISHELKTPLTSISLAVNGLCDKKLFSNAGTRDILIEDIKEANDRLGRIVNNLLDMTRIESGKLKLNLQWNDINDLLSVVENKFKKELAEYGFKKKVDCDMGPVKFDFGLIEQVVSNIVYNAIVHTRKGSEIRVSSYTKDNSIFIEVSDNGGGIKKIDKIFDKFYKEDSKKTGGLGIGLSICKAIIEFHKWELTASNNSIGGATFKIEIPIEGVE